jgi:ribose transport system substrate-binding protein
VVEQLAGRGKVLILDGPPGNQNALERRNGLIAGLSEGDIDVLGIRTALWERQAAHDITAEWLEQHGVIDAILAASDMMALGTIDAIAAAGRAGIIVTGFDANAEALLAIRNGRLHATVDQAPTQQARRAMHLMVRHLESGVSFPPVLLFDSIHLITAENVFYYQR